MNLKYQNILILNGVLGVTAQNRLYCRKSSWFVRGAFRPRGSSTTTTDRRTNARPTVRTTVRTTCRTMTRTTPSSALRCSGRLAPLGQSFANLWDKVCKHFSDVKQSSGFVFVPVCNQRRGNMTWPGVMKKSHTCTNTLHREHLGW